MTWCCNNTGGNVSAGIIQPSHSSTSAKTQ